MPTVNVAADVMGYKPCITAITCMTILQVWEEVFVGVSGDVGNYCHLALIITWLAS